MQKPSPTTTTISILSFILGAWLVFDSARKLVTGFYTGEQTIGLGPWATIISAIGVRPSDMAFPFFFLGIIWIVNGVIALLGSSTRYERTIGNLHRHTLLRTTRDPRQHRHHSLVFERTEARPAVSNKAARPLLGRCPKTES
jgi:hypothetical protein